MPVCHGPVSTVFHGTIPHFLELTFSPLPLPYCSLSLGDGLIQMSWLRLSSHVLSAFWQLWVSALTATHWGEKNLLWPKPRAVLIYGSEHKYLESSLIPYTFSKTTQEVPPWDLWCPQSWTFDQANRCETPPADQASNPTRKQLVTPS